MTNTRLRLVLFAVPLLLLVLGGVFLLLKGPSSPPPAPVPEPAVTGDPVEVTEEILRGLIEKSVEEGPDVTYFTRCKSTHQNNAKVEAEKLCRCIVNGTRAELQNRIRDPEFRMNELCEKIAAR